MNEVNDLLEHDIDFDEKHFDVYLFGFSCNAPARSFLKEVTVHTDKSGCERCNIVKVYFSNRTVLVF